MAESILKLRVDSTEYNDKLKRASQGLQQYAAQCRKVGGTLEVVEKDTLSYVKAVGRMETTSINAKGKLNEMTKAFVDLKMVYKEMSAAEKASPVGKALSESLSQLKVRIKETQSDLQSINQELGGGGTNGFAGAIDMLGQKLGFAGSITETLTSQTAMLTGAIGIGTTAVIAATKAWSEYNAEISKQQQITSVTTGLKGEDSDKMTSAARAMASTYNVDFREAINAANTLMSQFGKTGDEAIKIISDGLQGMIQGDGPKLLSMIQQYAPAFRDAGVSASQLVAVINNSEGGIFTDQNMNAIVMGIKNIRLMTSATSQALQKMGIDGDKMSKQLSDGSLTIFEALKQVAGALKNVDSNSKTAGEVMQQVFGRQGVTSGTNLAKAIETLNTNLEETKHQTGEVGVAYNELYQANLRLEEAMQKTFGYKGWEEMATGIKSTLVTAMASVLEKANAINDAFTNNIGLSYFQTIERAAENTLGPLGNVLKQIRLIIESGGGDVGAGAQIGGSISGLIPNSAPVSSIPEITVTGNAPKKSNTKAQSAPNIADFNTQLTKSLSNTEGLKPEELLGPSDVWEAYTSDIRSGLQGIDDEMTNLTAGDKNFDPYIKNMEKMRKSLMQEQMAFNLAGQAAGSFSQALSSMEDPAAKAAGTVVSAIASIALGFAMASSQSNTAGTGWGWIAWLAAGMAAMATTISTIHSLTGYANGGMIEGNSYSGDNLLAQGPDGGLIGLNAGEIVLSKSMQNNLANALTGNTNQIHVVGKVRGTDLILVMDRALQESGMGQLATFG